MSDSTLLPCPFCGNPPVRVRGQGNEWYIDCETPFCAAEGICATSDKAWNTRALSLRAPASAAPKPNWCRDALKRDGIAPNKDNERAALPSPSATRPEQHYGQIVRKVREIHQILKRGEATQDHGVIGNLNCILNHVLPPVPDPLTSEPSATRLDEVTAKVRKIHQVLKRGEDTQDHGLMGNLACILDHVLSPDPGEPSATREAVIEECARAIMNEYADAATNHPHEQYMVGLSNAMHIIRALAPSVEPTGKEK